MRYFEAEIVPGECRDDADIEIVENIPLDHGTELLVGRRLGAEVVGVDAGAVRAFAVDDSENPEDERMMKTFEHVGSGLTEIISSKKFWLETTASAKMLKRPRLDACAVAED